MPKKKIDGALSRAATLERFERALRSALNTPAEKSRAEKKKKAKKRKAAL